MTTRPGTFDGGDSSVDWLREVLGRRRSDLARAPISFLGAGLDNAAYRVGNDLVARISTATDPADRFAQVHRESRLLAAVADLSPLPVPRPRLTVAEEGLFVCCWLPGRPLLEAPPAQRAEHAATVGAHSAVSSRPCSGCRSRTLPGWSTPTTLRRGSGSRRLGP